MQLISDYDHLSPREFAELILGNLKANFGADLRPIFEAPGLSERDKLRQARNVLVEAVFLKAQRDGHWLDWSAYGLDGEHANIERVLAGDADEEPNLSIIPDDLKVVLGYRGKEVKTYLFSLTKRFENMQNAKTAGQLAIELAAGGLISVGIPAAIGAVKALRAGSAVLAAIRTGITSIGMKTAILAIAVVIVGFLLYLFLDNPKKLLGLVVNNTDDNLVTTNWRQGTDGANEGDLYMAFGHMASFMVDHESGLASPEVQVRARANFGPSDPDNVVFAGVYFADRNFGLRGAEGVILLTSKETGRRFAHLFACPYFEDNGANIAVVGSGSASSFYNDLYKKRKVSMEVVQDGYRLQANVNEPTGGVVGCIAAIGQI